MADLTEALDFIDPAVLDYTEWVQVGMALKAEGYGCEIWDEWSRRDPRRYHDGDCAKKWSSFSGLGTQVKGGTIVMMAQENGWNPHPERPDIALDWGSEIGGGDDLRVIDPAWIEGQEISGPAKNWDPAGELTRYLELLFDSTDTVGFVTKTWEKDGRFMPTKGTYTMTAGEIIDKLGKCGGDIGSVIGDYNEAAGAWIRFNPLDGQGVKNSNVTEYRYALVESDSMDIEKQNAMIRELELPVVCMVHSGGKSLHAIVRIDAPDMEEYRRRVDYLYAVLKKNGMEIDTQNRNPSRLSRMPGIMRNGKPQYIVDSNIGKGSWEEWRDYIEGVNDDLPDATNLSSVWDDLPELAPPLIEGVLRQGHKMLIAGPSKAGKSYALIELCCAIAEGRKWLGFQCAQGKVMYVNLELDGASCLHRFADIYAALGWEPRNIGNIDIWNLRGCSVPMDKLAPKLIRRAAKKKYIAIIIDPIYKVITGDENSADQMARFCNQFDLVCTELGASVIYCHHHSKGSQGQKRSMDRASGSGVFARDPDALLDMIQLDVSKELAEQQRNAAICDVCWDALCKYLPDDAEDKVSQDDRCSASAMRAACEKHLEQWQRVMLKDGINAAIKTVEQRTAWRIEGTLREFPRFEPVNVWFNYPRHLMDENGSLSDMKPDTEFDRTRNLGQKKSKAQKKEERIEKIDTAYEVCSANGIVTVKDLMSYLDIKTPDTIKSYIKEHGGFNEKNGVVVRKPQNTKN